MFHIQQTLAFALSKASQRVDAALSDEFKGYSITPRQFVVLAMLYKSDGLTQHEISRRTRIDRTTVGGMIDRLEGAGLVSRKQCPEDQRAFEVWLTKKGKSLEPELCEAAYRVRRRISQRLLPEEYKQLKHLLNKLVVGI